jgi:hypothetical protein
LQRFHGKMVGWKRTSGAAILSGTASRGYWVASSGNVTDEVWTEYIKNQKPPQPDDNFSVT